MAHTWSHTCAKELLYRYELPALKANDKYLMKEIVLYYIHDPMCSWCWGFKHTYEKLIKDLPNTIRIEKLLGGLAKDSDVEMPKEMQLSIKNTWQRIEQTIPGVLFNYEFWDKCIPKRSTYPACRAIIAAGKQHDKFKDLMLSEIQSAYYQHAKNPSELETLITISGKIGLDPIIFSHDIISDAVEHQLLTQLEKVRQLNVDSFPSLVLQLGGNIFRVPVSYTNHKTMIELIDSLTNS